MTAIPILLAAVAAGLVLFELAMKLLRRVGLPIAVEDVGVQVMLINHLPPRVPAGCVSGSVAGASNDFLSCLAHQALTALSVESLSG